MRTLATCGLLAAALLSCRRGDVEVFLPIDDAIRSAVVVAFVEDSPQVTAYELGDGVRAPLLDPYVGKYAVDVTALLYTQPLDALDLAPGRLATVFEGGRPVPATSDVRTTIVRGESVTAWESRSDAPERVRALRIAGEATECLEQGGCYDVDDPEAARCVVPCPEPRAPMPAEAVVMPALTPCPDGWTEADLGDGIVVCDPFPAGRKTDCARGSAHFLGERDCTPIGPACPAGRFPTELPTGTPVYVEAGANGTGTEAAPYGTISEALAGAESGTVVVVAAGRYAESFTVPIGVTVFGACTSGTTIATRDTIVLGGTLENVYLEEARVRVEAVANRATLRSVVSANAAGEAIRSSEVSGLLLEDVLVAEPERAGVVVWAGFATVRNVVVWGATSHGYVASDSTHDIEDLVIDGTRLSASNVARGMEIQKDADVEASRVWFGNGRDAAMFVDASEATLSDVVVGETASMGADSASGRGAFVQNEARLFIDRGWFHENSGSAVRVLNRAAVSMQDAVVWKTLPPSNGGSIHAEMTSQSLSLTRVAVLDAPYHGVQNNGPLMQATDLIVRRTGSTGELDKFGHGVLAAGDVTILRAHIADVDGAGIVAGSATRLLRVEDTVIERPSRRGCRLCTGICTQNAEEATLARVRVAGAAGLAIGQGELIAGRVVAQDIVVRDVGRIECDHSVSSPSLGLGDGVVTRGVLDLRRFEIEGCSNAGLSVGAGDDPSRVIVRDGFVHHNDIGLMLLFGPPRDANVLTRVRLEDNRVAIDTP